MTVARIAVIALALGAAVSAAPGQGAGGRGGAADTSIHIVPGDRVRAVVGPKAITYSEVLEELQRRIAQKAPLPPDSASAEKEILDDLVDTELLLQQAAQYKIVVKDDDVAPQIDKLIRQLRGSMPATEAEAKLHQAGYASFEDYRKVQITDAKRQKLQQIVIDSLQRHGRLPAVTVTDKDVEEEFAKFKLTAPKKGPTITFRQLVMVTRWSDSADASAKALADSLLHAIEAGAKFDSVARKYSADSGSAINGGQLDWMRRGATQPEFDRAIFTLPVGRLAPEPVKTVYGYHIIRVDRVRTGEVKASHILIRPRQYPSDVVRARELGDSLAGLLRKGAKYDSLAALYHDNAGREERIIADPYPVADLPDAYVAAVKDLKAGDVSKAFELPVEGAQPKICVVQILTRNDSGDPTLAEYQEKIRNSLRDAKSMRRLLDALRHETYVRVFP